MYFRRKSDGSFDSCYVYDLAHVSAGTTFKDAMASRGDKLGTIKCEDTSAPENERFTYDDSEKLNTIVNNVSCLISRTYVTTKTFFFQNTY